MKKLLIAALALALVFGVSGCGEYQPPQSSGSTGSDSSTETPSEDDQSTTAYTVTLHVNKTTERFIPDSSVQALWTNLDDGTFYKSGFGSTGIATAKNLNGDYRVTLTSLPDGYTYNPNINTASTDSKDVDITLYPITETKGSGSDYYSDLITVSELGAYRCTIKKSGQSIYFAYKPTVDGSYSFTSLVDITANEVNPFIDIYFSPQLQNVSETQDGGGEENTYTKNFIWQRGLSGTMIGNTFKFAIRAEGMRADAFPITIDFILDRDGEYVNPYSYYFETITLTQEEQEKLNTDFGGTAPRPSGTLYYIASLGGASKLLEQHNYQLNPETGYYQYLNENGTWGDYLYVMIAKDCEVVETETGKGFVDGLDGLLSLRVDGEDGRKDYTEFIRAYSTHVNSDGAYPVNEALRQFLMDFSIGQRLFYDGNGGAEAVGYNSSQKNQWLFACCFYQ